jgi:hypothetical protein
MAAEWIEQGLRALTNRYEYLYRLMLEFKAQLRALQQGLQAAQQQGSQGGSGPAASGAFAFCPSAIMNASGSCLGSAGTVLTGQTVEQFAAGTWTLVDSSATVYNATPSPIVAGQQCWLLADGSGNWVVITQSCN